MPSIRSNAFFNIAYEVVRLAFPLITYPYVSRILGPSGIGQVTYAQTLSTTFATFATLGIGFYGVREIAQSHGNNTLIQQRFSQLLLLSTILAWTGLVPYLLLLWIAPQVAAQRELHLIFAFNLFFSSARLDWFFQGIENYRYITIRNFGIRLLTVLLLFVVVRNSDDYLVYGGLWVAGTIASSLLNLTYAHRLVGFKWSLPDMKLMFRRIVPLSGLDLVNAYHASIDTILLGALVQDVRVSVGLYSTAGRIIRIALGMVVAGAAVLSPRIARVSSQGHDDDALRLVRKNIAFVLYASLPMAFGLYITARDVIWVFAGQDFLAATKTAKIMAPYLVFSAVLSVVGHQIFYARGKEKRLLAGSFVASIVLTLSAWSLIPILRHEGAAIALVGSALFHLVILFSLDHRSMAQVFFTHDNAMIIAVFLLWAVLLSVLAHTFSLIEGPLRLGLTVAAGATLYAAITLAFRLGPATTLAGWLKARNRNRKGT